MGRPGLVDVDDNGGRGGVGHGGDHVDCGRGRVRSGPQSQHDHGDTGDEEHDSQHGPHDRDDQNDSHEEEDDADYHGRRDHRDPLSARERHGRNPF